MKGDQEEHNRVQTLLKHSKRYKEQKQESKIKQKGVKEEGKRVREERREGRDNREGEGQKRRKSRVVRERQKKEIQHTQNWSLRKRKPK